MSRELVKEYSMYVVGKTESNHTWNAVPAFDGVSNIISIGMMQNAGSHAQTLLLLIKDNHPSLWNTLQSNAPRLASDVVNLPHSWDVWVNYSLTDSERVTVAGILDTEGGRAAQVQKWYDDADRYIDYALTLGFSLNHPKQLIYFMSMYHQSPQSANSVVSISGGSATLSYLHQVRANNNILSQYANRYNETYNMLTAWDGVSNPPDFGQGSIPSTGGQGGTVSRIESDITYMLKIGENFIIYGADKLKQGLLMFRAAGNRYIPAVNKEGTDLEPDFVGGGDNPDGLAIIEWLRARLGQWGYSMGPGRDNSDVTKVADCSSTWWQAYWHVAGIDVGTYTGAQMQKGTELLRTRSAQEVIDFAPQMQLADLILWSDVSYAMPAGAAAHVIGYSGNGKIIETGGGNPTHPTEKPIENASIFYGGGYFAVRRYL